MKDKIMPPLVLTIICIVVSGLLVLAYNATYVDNTGVLTDDMKKGCERRSFLFATVEWQDNNVIYSVY